MSVHYRQVSNMPDHRNISTRDLAYESYDEYIDARISGFFDGDMVSTVSHSWDYIHDAKALYETSRFQRLCEYLENEPCEAKWEHMKTADCMRCGEPGVGITGILDAVETPSGEVRSVGMHAELCEDCVEQVLDDFETTGELQPTLTDGRWWETEPASA